MTAEQIYISSQGKQWGPYTMKQVDFLLGKGSFQLSDLAWAESFAGWVALAELLGSLQRPEPVVAQPAMAAVVVVPVKEKKTHPLAQETDASLAWWRGGAFRKVLAGGVAGLALLLVVGWGGTEVGYNSLQRRDGLAFAPGSDRPFEGQAVSYHPNGQRMYSAEFRSGREDGQIFSWYPDGKKQSEAKMKNGNFHGVVTYWHENGRMMGHYTYENGHVLHRKNWDPEGNVYKRK